METKGDPREAADAEKVDRALQAIGEKRFDDARQLLEEVTANAPARYEREFDDGDSRVIKFWDRDEFIHHVLREKGKARGRAPSRDIVWKLSAYPRAYYYLAFIAVETGEDARALELLEAGERLEAHPSFLLERAQILIRAFGDRPAALACHQSIIDRGAEVAGGIRATALRGKGFVLIDLDRLDEAEACFRESLRLDPGSQVAASELDYIAHLRAGGEKAPEKLVNVAQPGSILCAACGGKFEGGKVADLDGRLIYLCELCERASRRRWWQFWRR